MKNLYIFYFVTCIEQNYSLKKYSIYWSLRGDSAGLCRLLAELLSAALAFKEEHLKPCKQRSEIRERASTLPPIPGTHLKQQICYK